MIWAKKHEPRDSSNVATVEAMAEATVSGFGTIVVTQS